MAPGTSRASCSQGRQGAGRCLEPQAEVEYGEIVKIPLGGLFFSIYINYHHTVFSGVKLCLQIQSGAQADGIVVGLEGEERRGFIPRRELRNFLDLVDERIVAILIGRVVLESESDDEMCHAKFQSEMKMKAHAQPLAAPVLDGDRVARNNWANLQRMMRRGHSPSVTSQGLVEVTDDVVPVQALEEGLPWRGGNELESISVSPNRDDCTG